MTTITLTVAPGIELTLEPAAAERLHAQLGQALTGVDATGALPDNHPLWERHSGGERHEGPEWSGRDRARAETFYAEVKGKAKVFFDLLLDRPGQQLSADQLIAAAPGTFANSFSIAGAINGLRLAQDASERRYPFYWWEGTPTRYAVKVSVASLFNQVRAGGSV